MVIIKSVVSILFVFISYSNILIPECFLDFRGNSKYSYRDSNRKSRWGKLSIEFKISPKKSAYNNIIDNYIAEFVNVDSTKIVEINIQLCDNKKFKQRALANYNLIGEHNILCHCHNRQGVTEFQIDSTTIYGLTAGDIHDSNLGDYVMFPSDKMAIYIRFSNGRVPEFTSIQNFIDARNDFIHSYLAYISICKSR